MKFWDRNPSPLYRCRVCGQAPTIVLWSRGPYAVCENSDCRELEAL